MLFFFNIIFISHFCHAEYSPNARFGAEFYYFLKACPSEVHRLHTKEVNVDYLASSVTLKDELVLSLARSHSIKTPVALFSEKLSILITKYSFHELRIVLPNLLALTFIDIAQLDRIPTDVNFPKLRVLNFIDVRFTGSVSITSFGSTSLEVLRFKRVNDVDIFFNSTSDSFENLRVLDVSRATDKPLHGVCDFLRGLHRLVKLVLSGENSCLLSVLKRLTEFPNLKVIRLYRNSLRIPSGELCLLFPPKIRALRFMWDSEIADTRRFTCYKELQSLELLVDVRKPRLLMSSTVSFSVFGIGEPGSPGAIQFGDLDSVKVLRLRNVLTNATKVPSAPNAVILHFNGNGFHFADGVSAFGDHAMVRILDLSNNPINFIPANAFRAVPQLSVLILQNTDIAVFSDAAFCGLLWPRMIVFDHSTPDTIRFSDPVQGGEIANNSVACLIHSGLENHIVITAAKCTCSMASFNLLSLETRERSLVSRIACRDDSKRDYFEFIETCDHQGVILKLSGSSDIRSCSQSSLFLCLLFFWIISVGICWTPPLVCYLRYQKGNRRRLLDTQLTAHREAVFIICPTHARTWCKRIVVPCIQADLFTHWQPTLRQAIRGERVSSVKSRQLSSRMPVCSSSSSRYSSTSHPSTSTVDAIQPVYHGPRGPWAWCPLFQCVLAPPTRHRLGLLLEASRVLIIFPSYSLLTEPACRAQLRLVYQMCRLDIIPPPGILVWPTTKKFATLSPDYRSVNKMKSICDHKKYYPALLFNKFRNDSNATTEAGRIKANVPSVNETKSILKYLATQRGCCVQWSNSRTVLQNLQPFVWHFNDRSQIPLY